MSIDTTKLSIKLDFLEYDKGIYKINKDLQELAAAAASTSKQIQSSLLENIITLLGTIISMTPGFDNMAEGFSEAMKAIEDRAIKWQEIFTGVYDGVVKAVSESLQTLLSMQIDTWDKFTKSMGKMWEEMKKVVIKALADILAAELAALVKKQIIAVKEMWLNAGVAATDAGKKDPNPYTKAITAIAVFGALGAIIAKTMGAFAQGGIVGGTSWSGDNVLARVNSGEMILTEGQQRRLFDLANGQGGANAGGAATINQTFIIENGTDLEGITEAVKRGTSEALDMANVIVAVGNKQQGLVY